MSGTKAFVKKPLRRYERAFEEEKSPESEADNGDELGTPLNPDITSPAGIKGPAMNSKKQPVRYKVKRSQGQNQGEEKPGGKNSGDKAE
jgi:hypothetical protein